MRSLKHLPHLGQHQQQGTAGVALVGLVQHCQHPRVFIQPLLQGAEVPGHLHTAGAVADKEQAGKLGVQLDIGRLVQRHRLRLAAGPI